jgi:hypothetical protein
VCGGAPATRNGDPMIQTGRHILAPGSLDSRRSSRTGPNDQADGGLGVGPSHHTRGPGRVLLPAPVFRRGETVETQGPNSKIHHQARTPTDNSASHVPSPTLALRFRSRICWLMVPSLALPPAAQWPLAPNYYTGRQHTVHTKRSGAVSHTTSSRYNGRRIPMSCETLAVGTIPSPGPALPGCPFDRHVILAHEPADPWQNGHYHAPIRPSASSQRRTRRWLP